MPADMVTKLSESLLRIAREPDFVKALTERGGVIVAGDADNLRAVIKAEAGRTGKLIKELGVSAQ
jgi:tripartite-type tricarboxylate transporter receptor subunit TctC